ncbi:hypothetical protein LXA43DRAFT_889971, partial [Ganoderma leucocontextum]
QVRIALEEARANYDFVSFPLDQRPEDYVKNIYPAGKVPSLVHGGVESFPAGKLTPGSDVIIESLVILEFLADLFPDGSLLPKDPAKRSKARIFMNILNLRMPNDIGTWLMNKDDGTTYLDLLESLQALLPDEGYAVGEWSVADAALLPFLLWMPIIVKTGVGYWVKLKDVENVKTQWASPRFARLRKYYDESIARLSTKATWDEVGVVIWRPHKLKQRLMARSSNRNL